MSAGASRFSCQIDGHAAWHITGINIVISNNLAAHQNQSLMSTNAAGIKPQGVLKSSNIPFYYA
jgi:hypothetical protein